MSAHLLAMSSQLFASFLRKGERIRERGSTLLLGVRNPHPTLSLEKGEANLALTK
jgi:hypothetical protein